MSGPNAFSRETSQFPVVQRTSIKFFRRVTRFWTGLFRDIGLRTYFARDIGRGFGDPATYMPETLRQMMTNQLPAGENISFANLGPIPGKGFGLGGAVTFAPMPFDPPNSTGEFQWGGLAGTTPLGSGGVYDLASDTWTAIPASGAPSPRFSIAAAWTGAQMIAWGGSNFTDWQANGSVFDPGAASWVGAKL